MKDWIEDLREMVDIEAHREAIAFDELKDSLIVIKVGSEERPASDSDIETVRKAMKSIVHDRYDGCNPLILVTHHVFNVETIKIKDILK
jgi:hypothetical protein